MPILILFFSPLTAIYVNTFFFQSHVNWKNLTKQVPTFSLKLPLYSSKLPLENVSIKLKSSFDFSWSWFTSTIFNNCFLIENVSSLKKVQLSKSKLTPNPSTCYETWVTFPVKPERLSSTTVDPTSYPQKWNLLPHNLMGLLLLLII